MAEAAHTLKLNPWHARAEDLARWAMLRLVNRTDRCGRYGTDKDTGKAKPYADPTDESHAKLGYFSHFRLTRHFRASDRSEVVGSYAYGADKFGKWANIDIDNHDDEADPLANERFAVHVARKATAIGLCVLLYESNGKGGFHLWVLFDGAVPARILRSLGDWLVSDFADWKFEQQPEVFPKGECDKPWGNWVRVPGRHHTRDVWPRVWSGEEWLTDDAAVSHLLSLKGCDPDLIPPAAATYGIEVQTGGSGPRPDRPAGVVFAWEDFNQKAALADMAEVLQRHYWTRGRGRGDGAIEMIRPGKNERGAQGGNLLLVNGVPIFFCFTDGAPPLKPMTGYAPAALVAILDHGGDFKASNKALYEKGFGTRVTKKTAAPKAGQEGYQPNAQVTEEDGDSELVFASVAGIVPEAVHYLVPGYIPRGMVGMLAGDGGHGKSMITLELAAALSVGRCAFGMEYPNPTLGKTLLISCEDDWQRTILPRLAAMGADRNNILRVEGVRMKKNGKAQILDFHMGHYAELQRALQANPDIALIVIDPAGAYIGRAGVNENQDAELRSVLGPLSEAANLTGTCVLLIKHLNKSAGVSAVQRVGGGGAYVNAVRFSYMVAPDPDDPDKKLILPLKTNVLKAGLTGLAYRMEDLTHAEGVAVLRREWPFMKAEDVNELAKQLFRPKWEGNVAVTANDISGGKAKPKKQENGNAQECAKLIQQSLGRTHAFPESELKDFVLRSGFSFWAYATAKKELAFSDPAHPERYSTAPSGKGGDWWCWIGPKRPRPSDRPPHLSLNIINNKERENIKETNETSGDGGSNYNDGGESKFPRLDGLFGGIPPSAHDPETSPTSGGVL